jgi:DNA-binding protein YbaB
MWQKLKPEKPNIDTKVISKPNLTTMIETHSKDDIVAIEVNNQMAIIQIQVGKNIVENVLLYGGANFNIIIENLITKLGLPKPRLVPYHLKMANLNMTRPLGIIQNLKIYIHGIPYVTTFTIVKNIVVDSNYPMLLGKPWLRDAKVTYDRGNNLITVQGNGTVRTILVNKKLGV